MISFVISRLSGTAIFSALLVTLHVTRACPSLFNATRLFPSTVLITSEINSRDVMDGEWPGDDTQRLREWESVMRPRGTGTSGRGREATIQKEEARATWSEGEEPGQRRRSGSKSIKCPAKTFSALYKISASSFVRLQFTSPRSRRQRFSSLVYSPSQFFPTAIRFSFTFKVAKTFPSFAKVNFGTYIYRTSSLRNLNRATMR